MLLLFTYAFIYLWFVFPHWNANSKRAGTLHPQDLEIFTGLEPVLWQKFNQHLWNEWGRMSEGPGTPSYQAVASACIKSVSWLLLCYKLSQKLMSYYARITMVFKPTGQLDSDANLGWVWSILVQLTWICDHLGGWPKVAGSGKASLRSLAVAWLSERVTGGLGHTSRSSNCAASSCGHHL